MTAPNQSRIPQRLIGLFHATALVAVSACGGNGNGNGSAGAPVAAPPPPAVGPAAAAAGLYNGPETVSGRYTSTLVLDSGRFYQFYGPLSGALSPVVGVRMGDGTLTGSSFSASTVLDFVQTSGLLSGTGTLSASLGASASSLNGSITRGSTTVAFTNTSNPATYRTVVSASTLSGTYPNNTSVAFGSLVETGTVTINSSGVLSASTSPSACSLSGTAVPSASVNVIDVSITFSGGCGTALNSKTLTGHGYYAAPQLLIAVSDSTQIVLLGAAR